MSNIEITNDTTLGEMIDWLGDNNLSGGMTMVGDPGDPLAAVVAVFTGPASDEFAAKVHEAMKEAEAKNAARIAGAPDKEKLNG